MYCTCLVVCISTCTYVGAVLFLLYFFTSIFFFTSLEYKKMLEACSLLEFKLDVGMTSYTKMDTPINGKVEDFVHCLRQCQPTLSQAPAAVCVWGWTLNRSRHWWPAPWSKSSWTWPWPATARWKPPISGEVEDFVHCLQQCEPSIFTSSCCLCVRMNNLEQTAMSDVCLLPVSLYWSEYIFSQE